MRLTYTYPVGAWNQFSDVTAKGMVKAGKEAVKKTATAARDNSRKSISGAGFSSRWQKAMQFTLDKKPPSNAIASALIFHRIPFAIVFEEGATIRGKPKLWLPIEGNVPIGIKSPRDYVKRVGPLVSVNRPGKPPLLFAKALPKPKSVLSPERRAKLAAVERSRGMKPPTAGERQERKPLFVGVDAATIHRRFAIKDAIRAAVDNLGQFYVEALKSELPNG